MARPDRDNHGNDIDRWLNSSSHFRARTMNDQLTQAADDLLALSPEQVDKIDRLIARWQCAVNALRVLATRPYFSAEQAAMIRAEADELAEKDIEPLWAALRDGT